MEFIFIQINYVYNKKIIVDSFDYEVWILRSLVGLLSLLLTIGLTAMGVQRKRKQSGKVVLNKRVNRVVEEFMTTRL